MVTLKLLNQLKNFLQYVLYGERNLQEDKFYPVFVMGWGGCKWVGMKIFQ